MPHCAVHLPSDPPSCAMTVDLLPASAPGAFVWLYFQCSGPLQRAEGANRNRNLSFNDLDDPLATAGTAGVNA